MASESSDPRAPRIGVTWVAPGERVSDNYLEAVRRAGSEPVPLPSESDCWEAELRDVDGLMLTGGVDVDPDLYGVEKRAECQPPDPVRDRRETEALRFALEQGLPVLGICRGFQFLNVYLGGTLLQDIPTERPEALTHHRPEGAERSRRGWRARTGGSWWGCSATPSVPARRRRWRRCSEPWWMRPAKSVALRTPCSCLRRLLKPLGLVLVVRLVAVDPAVLEPDGPLHVAGVLGVVGHHQHR